MALPFPLDAFSSSFTTDYTGDSPVNSLLATAKKNLESKWVQSTGRPVDESEWAIPHHLTFAAVWNWTQKYYYSYYDEALKDSLESSMAMRRDGFIQELLWHRQLPTVCLDFALECDDADDPGQSQVRKDLEKVIRRIPYLQRMKLQLLESLYYGKSGVQVVWGEKKFGKEKRKTIIKHLPLNGDKITYSWDGTPAIFIYRASSLLQDARAADLISNRDRGPALVLSDPYFRDRFIIHEFQPTDTDYLFESEKAAASHGLGIRDRFYWTWNMRVQALAWYLNAVERVGANGMIYGRYPSGNIASRNATLSAIKDLINNNVAVFPTTMGDNGPILERIDPASVSFDQMFQLILHLEGIMRRGILGQDASGTSHQSSMGQDGQGMAAQSKEDTVIFDSSCLAECLDEQMVQKIVSMNEWEYEGKKYRGEDLPFQIRLRLQADRQNVRDLIASAESLWRMGVPLDMDDVRDRTGLAAPRSKATTLVQMGGMTGATPNAGAVASDTGGKGMPDNPAQMTQGEGGGGRIGSATDLMKEKPSQMGFGHTSKNQDKEKFAANPCGDGGPSQGFQKGNTCASGGTSQPDATQIKEVAKRAKNLNVSPKESIRNAAKAESGRRWVAVREDLPKDVREILTDDDIKEFKSPSNVRKFVSLYRRAISGKSGVLPTLEEVKAMAQAGEAAAGQYGVTGRAMRALIGDKMTNAWSVVNGILSAQSRWEDHSTASLVLLRYWSDAGKPTDDKGINDVFEDFHENFRRESTDPKKKGVSVKAYPLFDTDKKKKVREVFKNFDNISDSMIGGEGVRKTREFARASRDSEGVAIDTHMAKLMSPENKEFKVDARNASNIEKIIESGNTSILSGLLLAQQSLVQGASQSAEYNSYKALITKASQELGWEPKEVMEAAWSAIIAVQVLKTKENPATGKKFTSEQIIDNLSNITTGSAWDISQIMTSEDMKNEYRRLGVPESTIKSVDIGIRERFGYSKPESVRVGNRAAFVSAAKRIPPNAKTGGRVKVVLPTGEEIKRYAIDDDLEFFAASHNDPENPGVMLALMLPPEAANDLAIEGGEPASELHITIAYLGRLKEVGQEAVDRVAEACGLVAEAWGPISASVGGIGRFSASPSSDGKDVIYASIDSPVIHDFRDELCEVLDLIKVPYKKNHGFTPHITLSYVDSKESSPIDRLTTTPLLFGSLNLVIGGNVQEFKFTSSDSPVISRMED